MCVPWHIGACIALLRIPKGFKYREGVEDLVLVPNDDKPPPNRSGLRELESSLLLQQIKVKLNKSRIVILFNDEATNNARKIEHYSLKLLRGS